MTVYGVSGAKYKFPDLLTYNSLSLY